MAEIIDGRLLVKLKNSSGSKRTTDLTELLSFGDCKAIEICRSLKRWTSKYNSFGNAGKVRSVFKQFGRYYLLHNSDLKDPKLTYLLLFNFREYYYSTETIKANLVSRNSRWDTFKLFFEFLMDDGIFPTITVPPGNPKLHKRDILEKQSFVVNSPGVLKHDQEAVTTICPISLARNDEEYLDELEAQFVTAKNVFLNCARKELALIRSNVERGELIAAGVDYEYINKCLKEAKSDKRPFNIPFSCRVKKRNGTVINYRREINMFGPKCTDAVANILCYIKNKYGGFYPCLLDRRNQKDKAFSRLIHVIGASDLGDLLGVLTPRKAVPFIVFLLLKNPKFNVESLQRVEVTSGNVNNSMLTMAGEDGVATRMKVKKPRAKSEKFELLDDESKEVVALLLRMTDPIRGYLKKKGSPDCNKLWICGGTNGGSEPYVISNENFNKQFGSYLRSIDNPNVKKFKSRVSLANRSFLASHPELKSYIPHATLAKLRTTAGLVNWFESNGDAKAVARALGNTVKVTVDHYIPMPLQVLMNKRVVRRVQNLLIAAATAGESYMLEATDFSKIEELHSFLAQMLDPDRVSGNSVLKFLSERIDSKSSIATTSYDEIINDGIQIAVNISEERLAVLFLYEEHINNSPAPWEIKKKGDRKTLTSPIFWVGLSQALKSALPRHEARRELSLIYEASLARMDALRMGIRFPKLALS